MRDDLLQFTGKYESAGRIARRLIDRFYDSVIEMLDPNTAGTKILEIGCGAGFSTSYLRRSLTHTQKLFATDIGEALLSEAVCRNSEISFFQSSVYHLPLPDKSVDSIVMLEVLEHLHWPERALSELARVARHRVVISTPREPIWCALNLARGKYISRLGNTPGHIQHWSGRGLKSEVRPFFKLEDIRQPLPWTILRLRPY